MKYSDNNDKYMDKQKDISKKPMGNPPGKGVPGKKVATLNRGPLSWLIIGMIFLMAIMMFSRMQGVEEMNYSPDFIDYVKANHVESVKIHDYKITGEFNVDGISARGADSPASFKVNYNPPMHSEELLKLLGEHKVEFGGIEPSPWANVIASLLPLLFLIGIIYFVFIRNMKSGGGGMLMNFGRSKHKVRGKELQELKDALSDVEDAKARLREKAEQVLGTRPPSQG